MTLKLITRTRKTRYFIGTKPKDLIAYSYDETLKPGQTLACQVYSWNIDMRDHTQGPGSIKIIDDNTIELTTNEKRKITVCEGTINHIQESLDASYNTIYDLHQDLPFKQELGIVANNILDKVTLGILGSSLRKETLIEWSASPERR